ncbi:hypothetical protein A7A08_02210 [Methyloligella halotolerans]|uniref:Uncharacterized protein n=1 Tax=Methyloligella halotolerans TaxID=1177755 RepID=A0A1E2RXG8_9HYPH|nr:hypothetical protein [Methyloligella halotolerans]ODA66913.1 hypothetical protein A7A08_02210 [Methyloligella halotolerans]
MTKRILAATTFAMAAALIAVTATPASAGLFRNKERQAANGEEVVVFNSPRRSSRIARRYVIDQPLTLNNKVYPGMRFEPPSSAFFGGNPMIGPSSW